MDLILFILGMALIGLLTWIVTTYIPMDPIFRIIIYVVVAVALVLFLVRRFAGSVPHILN